MAEKHAAPNSRQAAEALSAKYDSPNGGLRAIRERNGVRYGDDDVPPEEPPPAAARPVVVVTPRTVRRRPSTEICSVIGCRNPRVVQGMCRSHYNGERRRRQTPGGGTTLLGGFGYRDVWDWAIREGLVNRSRPGRPSQALIDGYRDRFLQGEGGATAATGG